MTIATAKIQEIFNPTARTTPSKAERGVTPNIPQLIQPSVPSNRNAQQKKLPMIRKMSRDRKISSKREISTMNMVMKTSIPQEMD